MVQDVVREYLCRTREMFVPLIHPPGGAQVDFPEAVVLIAGVASVADAQLSDHPQAVGRVGAWTALRRRP